VPTSPSVRTPVGLLCSSRLRPSAPPMTIAAPSRSTISIQPSVGPHHRSKHLMLRRRRSLAHPLHALNILTPLRSQRREGDEIAGNCDRPHQRPPSFMGIGLCRQGRSRTGNAKHWSSRAHRMPMAKRPSLTGTAARQRNATCVNARCRGAHAGDRASPDRSGGARPPPSRRRHWQRPAA